MPCLFAVGLGGQHAAALTGVLVAVLVAVAVPVGSACAQAQAATRPQDEAERSEPARPRVELRATVDRQNPSRDGTFTLEWAPSQEVSTPEPPSFRVQLAMPPDNATFVDWYVGAARQSFVSGAPSGEVRARVQMRGASGAWGAWSDVLVIPVQHHAMEKALGLMVLGFFVFMLVLGYIAKASGSGEKEAPSGAGS